MTDNTVPDSPGGGEPNEAEPEAAFTFVLGRAALDDMCKMLGLVPNHELRFTIAQELQNQVMPWLTHTVKDVALRIQHSN